MKYVIILWPESQDIEYGKNDCHLIDQSVYPEYGSSAYLVPETYAKRKGLI